MPDLLWTLSFVFKLISRTKTITFCDSDICKWQKEIIKYMGIIIFSIYYSNILCIDRERIEQLRELQF